MQQQRTNRDKLLDGALACLRERGYGNTSSRDIARAAGVNIASINYHFGSKDALLDDALGRCFSTWNQRVQEAFDHPAPPVRPGRSWRYSKPPSIRSSRSAPPCMRVWSHTLRRCAQRPCGSAWPPDMPTFGSIRSIWLALRLPVPT